MFKFRAACSQSRSSEDAPVHSFTKCQKENSSRERERERESGGSRCSTPILEYCATRYDIKLAIPGSLSHTEKRPIASWATKLERCFLY